MKNRLFAFYFIVFLIFGVILCEFISVEFQFTYIDEILLLVLLLFSLFFPVKKRKIFSTWEDKRALFIVAGIFAFYFFYSLVIESNCLQAIAGDLIIQMKPYLAFFCTMIIAPDLLNEKKIIRRIILCCLPVLIIDGVMSLPSVQENIIFHHPARLATAVTAVALSYLYVSGFSRKHIVRGVIILSIGLLSFRAKMYGIYGVVIIMLLFFYRFELKIRLKTVFVACLLAIIVFFLAYDKFYYYFITGSEDVNNLAARPALYLSALDILQTDVPFGSGLGSYATFYSGKYYSPVYHKLGLDTVFGLSPEFSSFMTDAFFPSLAEFGIVGVFLFFYFWYYIIRRANLYKMKQGRPQMEYLLVIIIFSFYMIESIAASTFTHNGVFMMILLALCLTNLKRKYNIAQLYRKGDLTGKS
jgi:hypothetical protein